MIKKLDITKTPFVSKNTKFNAFMADIKEIVVNKIEFCEFVNMPYSSNISNHDLEYKARKITRILFRERTGKEPKNNNFFVFAKKVIDNETHFYAQFLVSDWEKAVNELKHEA